ncbi:DUF4118 domain-containing protein [Streptomyces sp. AcE210]|uniref:DUF4118 domain-containing protein n=1 Tax=Streptomyces sp. AcE210 TaxID=2292703 RepID=UPI0026B5866F
MTGNPLTGYPVRDRIALAAGLVGPFLVALVLVPFRRDLSATNAALILVVVVVAVAAVGSRVAGAVAALSAAAWFDFFLTRPYQRFGITDSDDVETAVLLLVVGLIVSQLAARARRLKVVTVTDAEYLARIHGTADLAQSTTSADAVVGHVRAQLTELLGLRGCRFEYGTLLGRPQALGRRRRGLAGRRDRTARVRQRPVPRSLHAHARSGPRPVTPGPPGSRDTRRSDGCGAGHHTPGEGRLRVGADARPVP